MTRIATLLLAVAFTSCSTVFACSCLRPPPPKKALEQASAVFSGTVKSVELKNGMHHVTFDIERTWKGTKGTSLVVVTATNSAACGVNFQAKQAYLVYCFTGKDGVVRTNICTRTNSLKNAAADIAELGKGKKPTAA